MNTYCRENDTVIFYFAGYGALTDAKGAGGDGHRKYLMMADTDVDNLSETAFSLTELDEICDALPAKNVILMFDASFNQGGETRTYIDVRQPPAEVTLDDAYLTQLSDNPGHIVVAACQPNEGALMLDEEQRGLFTHYFLQAVETEVTGSDDQIVTLAEVFQAALPNAQDRADIEGVTQTPTVYGTGAGDVALVYLGGTRAAPEDDEGGSEEPPVEDGGEEEGAPGGGE